jgi:predicted permease
MSFRSDLLERLRSLLFRSRQDRDLDEEMRFHLEREVAERIRAGEDPARARQQARAEFGSMAGSKEAVRDERGIRPLDDLGADLRYGFRSLRRSPGFTVTAALVLGAGLGASAAVFAVVDTVVLSELPYPDADRLVRIYQRNSPVNLFGVSAVDYQAIESQQRTFDAVGAVQRGEAGLTGGGLPPERVVAAQATEGFFRALGIRPAAGRLVARSDEAAGAPPVAVSSHGLAVARFGGPAQALGRSLVIDGVSHLVVGVLRPDAGQVAGVRAAVWSALRIAPPTRRGPFLLRAIARLRPGATLDEATRDLAGISERIFPLWAAGFQDRSARLTPLPLRQTIVGSAQSGIALFGGAVGLVLLIAVANVATLMLVRASARGQELAVRAALGASRLRLARLVVTESLALAAIAAAVAVGIAAGGLGLVGAIAPDLPRLGEIGLGRGMFGFIVAAAIGTGLLVSVPPIVQLVIRPAGSIVTDPRRVGTSGRTNAVRGALVVLEFALALPLLAGAGLLLATFLRLSRVDPGFDPAGLVAIEVSLPAARYPDPASLQRYWRQALDRLEATPGVRAAGLTNSLPPDEPADINNFDLVSRRVPSGTAQPIAPWVTASADLFPTLGVSLLDGRGFSAADTGSAPPVVLVSRAWARRYFGGESAVGQTLVSGGCDTCPRTTVIGIVGDVKYLGLAGSDEAVYQPMGQAPPQGPAYLLVRTSDPRSAVAAVAAVDPELPLQTLAMAERIDHSLAARRRVTAVLGAFAAAALALAALGVFGLMSYIVRQRRREIGVRLALGADRGAITRMVMSRGMRYAAAGFGLGLIGVAVEIPWLRSQLFGIAPTDPTTLSAAALLLLGAAAAACWLPGRRAARIHPVEAINSE